MEDEWTNVISGDRLVNHLRHTLNSRSIVQASRVGECVDSLSERFDPFELHVLLVSHLNQESLYPRETP